MFVQKRNRKFSMKKKKHFYIQLTDDRNQLQFLQINNFCAKHAHNCRLKDGK